MTLPNWFERGACRGLGSVEFVQGPAADYSQTAREMCATCPVRRQCLDFALADPNIYGLWGGTDERERKAMRSAF